MSRLRLVAAALALGAILLVAAPSARAWTPIDPSNPVWALPVPYSLNQAGSPDLGGFAASEAEVRRAMDDWTRVSCTSLRNAYQGSTTRQPGSFEGTSTIGWVESGWRYESQAIGVTTPAFGRRGIAEADMALNGVNFTWTTASGSFNNVNAYSIILHEGGHYYGLGHTNVAGSTMWPSYSGGIVGLGPDDQNGICALYPGSGSDCTTTGCPSGQECVSGTCQAIVGDGMICSACSSDSDCGGPSDLCIRYPNGRTYCGRSCSTSADCSGDTCASLSGGGRQCARVVGSNFTCEGTVAPGTCTLSSDCPMGQICTSGTCTTPASGAGLGEPCTGNMECSSMLCLGGSCTQSCDSTNVLGSCPGEFYCDADSASCGTGYCRRGGFGAGMLGSPCALDTECASAFCESGTCSQPCVPGGALGCPDGFACQVGTLPCQGSCQQSGTLGDMCDGNEDCTSGICAMLGEISFCTDICDDATPCPERFTCTPAGTVSVCVPDAGGLGAECASNMDCISGICAMEASRSYCTRACDAMTPCPPDSYVCSATSDPNTSVCQPLIDPMSDGGCGCHTAGAPAPWRSALPSTLLGLLFLVRRRRR